MAAASWPAVHAPDGCLGWARRWSRRGVVGARRKGLGVAVHLHRPTKETRTHDAGARGPRGRARNSTRKRKQRCIESPPAADAMLCCALCVVLLGLVCGGGNRSTGRGTPLVVSSIGSGRPGRLSPPPSCAHPISDRNTRHSHLPTPPHPTHNPHGERSRASSSSSSHHGAGDDGARGRAGADAHRGLQLPAGGGPGAFVCACIDRYWWVGEC